MSTTASENECVATRTLQAPRELVYRAWEAPEQLAQWWGPQGFTNTFRQFEMKPGGVWKLVMHGPDGVDYRNESVFVEVVKPERIVIDHVTGPRFRLTATFEAVSDEQTRLVFRQRFESAAEFERAKSYCIEANEQNIDRLEELLRRLAAQR